MFKLRACLVITCINDLMEQPVQMAVATRDGELPIREISPLYTDVDSHIAEMFKNITSFSPQWAGVSFDTYTINYGHITFFYKAQISKHDDLADGFEWNTDISKIDWYGLEYANIVKI